MVYRGLPGLLSFCALIERLVFFTLGRVSFLFFKFLARRPGSNGSFPGLRPWTWIYACISLDDTDDLHPGWTNGTRC